MRRGGRPHPTLPPPGVPTPPAASRVLRGRGGRGASGAAAAWARDGGTVRGRPGGAGRHGPRRTRHRTAVEPSPGAETVGDGPKTHGPWRASHAVRRGTWRPQAPRETGGPGGPPCGPARPRATTGGYRGETPQPWRTRGPWYIPWYIPGGQIPGPIVGKIVGKSGGGPPGSPEGGSTQPLAGVGGGAGI